jgi:hypothetical protein
MRIALAVALAFLAAPVAAEPTDVHVRVLSLGAKFVGSSMGGVEVVLRDVATGAILSRGMVEGSTGDTAKIMGGGPRNTPVSTADSGVFRGVIDIDEPRLVQVEARGPLAQPQAAVTVTSQQWILPGKGPGRGMTAGDGWLLELPGLVVDAVEPAAHEVLAKGTATRRVAVNVALMCGCPITPGGMWAAERFDVRASVRRGGGAPFEVSLAYAGRTGHFAADLPLKGSGAYVVTLSAVDTKTGATGVDRTSFLLP